MYSGKIEFKQRLTLWIIRFIIVNVTVMDCMRHLLGIALMFIGTIWILNCCVYLTTEEYEDALDIKHKLRAIQMYSMVHLSLNGVRAAQATVALVMIGGMAVGLTMCLCITVVFYGKVPFNVYIMAPVTGAIVILVIQITIPQVIVVSDMSKEMIRKWRASSNTLYMRKVSRSMSPLHIYIGFLEYSFVALDREFKISYYNSILDYTTMFLMSYKAV